ncbi:MAG TPA: HD domain-containing phosphohydrolase [Gemmatimonadaceae bacterium]
MNSTPVPATPAPIVDGNGDPLLVMKELITLRRLVGLYPTGHPQIEEKLRELDSAVQRRLDQSPSLQLDVVRGDVHIDGDAYRQESRTHAHLITELTDIGIQSIRIEAGVTAAELRATAEFLWQFDGRHGGDAVRERLSRAGVQHVTLGRIVPLDTKWVSKAWPDGPTGPVDPAYEEALVMAQSAFSKVSSGGDLDASSVRDTVQLLVNRVANSNAALGHVLAVKHYENLTWCHSVNVAMLSLLIGRQIGLDGQMIVALVEAALLHDIGKTRVPLEVVQKPGALDKSERKLIEAHAAYGGEILAGTTGLRPLTATVALEHHRSIVGGGYPDLGAGVIPHPMSQIVSVADVYEALTGARSYKEPTPPERACVILARIAGEQLNPSLVKAFVSTVTFFPIGSFVRTNREEIGVVVRTSAEDPLRPVIALLREDAAAVTAHVDLAGSEGQGRHIVETIPPPENAPSLKDLLDAPTPL